MSLDPYSLCPGGTGKKIKFCCHELLGGAGGVADRHGDTEIGQACDQRRGTVDLRSDRHESHTAGGPPVDLTEAKA